MIKRDIIKGVIVELDDGDESTSHIIDESESEELCRQADLKRLEFVRKQAKSFGYKLVKG